MPEVGDCGVQLATGTFRFVTVLQVIVIQPFPEVGDCGVQLATPVVVEKLVHFVSW